MSCEGDHHHAHDGQPARDPHALQQSDQRRQHETEQNSQRYRYDDLATKIQHHDDDGREDRRCHRAQQGNQFFWCSCFERLSYHNPSRRRESRRLRGEMLQRRLNGRYPPWFPIRGAIYLSGALRDRPRPRAAAGYRSGHCASGRPRRPTPGSFNAGRRMSSPTTPPKKLSSTPSIHPIVSPR